MAYRLFFLFCCILFPTHSYSKDIKILTDISPVSAIVSEVLGETGTVESIISPQVSPHHFHLKPSQASKIAHADIIFYIGDTLTPLFGKTIKKINPTVTLISLMDYPHTQHLEARETALHDHGHGDHSEHAHEEHAHDEHAHDEHAHEEHAHDEHAHEEHAHDEHAHEEHAHEEHAHEEHAHDEHAHEEHAHDEHAHDEHAHDEHAHEEHAHEKHAHDEHAYEEHAHEEHGEDEHGHHETNKTIDPHGWLSPDNAKYWATEIANELGKRNPDYHTVYLKNAAKFSVALDAKTIEIKEKLSKLPSADYIIYHDAFQYFENYFGLQSHASLSLFDGDTPTPKRIAAIRDAIEKHNIECIFSEIGVYPKFLKALGSETIRYTPLDQIGINGENYFELIGQISDQLVSCLTHE